MSLSILFLAFYLFLQGAALVGWFAVGNVFLGVVALITALLLVVEGGPTIYQRYIVRKP